MRKLMIFILLSVLAAGSVSAEEVLDLEACLKLALENDPALRQSSIDVGTASAAVENSWSLLLPSFSLRMGTSWSDSLFTPGSSFGDPVNYSLGASLSLQLNRGIPVRVKILGLNAAAAEISFESVREGLVSDVTRKFYSLLLARSELELLREDLELSRKQLEKSDTRFQNGLISERILLQTRLEVETSKLALSRSTSSYELEKRSFLNTLGIEGAAGVSFEGKIEPELLEYDTDELITTYLSDRTDLRSAALSLRQQELSLKT